MFWLLCIIIAYSFKLPRQSFVLINMAFVRCTGLAKKADVPSIYSWDSSDYDGVFGCFCCITLARRADASANSSSSLGGSEMRSASGKPRKVDRQIFLTDVP